MDFFSGQNWGELSQPGRWAESLRPAMAVLEARLPERLGAGIWLHRNVSWSDLQPVSGAGGQPKAGEAWPLMYLVCRRSKVLFGFCLEARQVFHRERVSHDAAGIPYYRYAVNPANPSDLEAVLRDIVGEMPYRRQPRWLCAAGPVHPEREDGGLLACGLVDKAANGWLPTGRGEDYGLISMFTMKNGKVVQKTLWSSATQRALTLGAEPRRISLRARASLLDKGLASSDAAAANAVLELSDMPLSDFLLSCPDVTQADLQKLQAMLRLPEGCSFCSAAAALYRRVVETGNGVERARLIPVITLMCIPFCDLEPNKRDVALKSFRKGRFPK